MQKTSNKADMADLAAVLKELPESEAAKVYGFALGLKAKQETENRAV